MRWFQALAAMPQGFSAELAPHVKHGKILNRSLFKAPCFSRYHANILGVAQVFSKLFVAFNAEDAGSWKNHSSRFQMHHQETQKKRSKIPWYAWSRFCWHPKVLFIRTHNINKKYAAENLDRSCNKPFKTAEISHGYADLPGMLSFQKKV